jgi:hypothetical protein
MGMGRSVSDGVKTAVIAILCILAEPLPNTRSGGVLERGRKWSGSWYMLSRPFRLVQSIVPARQRTKYR